MWEKNQHIKKNSEAKDEHENLEKAKQNSLIVFFFYKTVPFESVTKFRNPAV